MIAWLSSSTARPGGRCPPRPSLPSAYESVSASIGSARELRARSGEARRSRRPAGRLGGAIGRSRLDRCWNAEAFPPRSARRRCRHFSDSAISTMIATPLGERRPWPRGAMATRRSGSISQPTVSTANKSPRRSRHSSRRSSVRDGSLAPVPRCGRSPAVSAQRGSRRDDRVGARRRARGLARCAEWRMAEPAPYGSEQVCG